VAQAPLKSARSARLKLLAVAALFVLPIVVALVLRGVGYEPRATRNHGTLLAEPVDFNAVLARGADGQPIAWNSAAGTWHVLLPAPTPCGTVCVGMVDALRRVWLLLGSKAARVRMLYAGEPEPATRTMLDAFVQMRVVEFAHEAAPAQVTEAGMAVYLIDPNGYLVMRYAPGFDPLGLRDDLKQLLKR
jgi:cytochrome oxidase Cu insertion factor (SCO1/SenC/PrrC family)